MAETVAAALPGTFMACVQCFELIHFGRNFKEDFAVSAADLKMCEIHLLRWGTASGLSEADTSQLPEKLAKYPEDQLQKAVLVLKRIVSIFNSTKESSQFDSIDDEDSNDTVPLQEDDQLQGQNARLQKSHEHLNKVKAKYKSAVKAVKGAAQGASDRTKWALYKKKHLMGLVEQVSNSIDRLEKLFPELLEAERRMAQEEVEGAEREVIQALPAMAAKIDPVLVEALTARMKSLGMTFGDVEAGDRVRAHLGNIYAPREKSTGHDDHTFGNLKLGGHARFHGGDVYGNRASRVDSQEIEDGK